MTAEPTSPHRAPGRAHGDLPRLRPGRAVLRRDAATLQIGLDRYAVRLADTPAIRALLAALDPRHVPVPGAGVVDPAELADPADPAVRDALSRLSAHGHLTTSGAAPRDRPAVVGLVDATPASRDRIAPLLAQAGLALGERSAIAWLVLAAGPPRRETVDDLVRAGAPHLVVSGLEETRRVGPFVVPGRTACLRCVDAHESVHDPRRPLLVEQAAVAAARFPEPVDPLLDQLTLLLAVRDLATFADGREPATWSATIDVPGPDAPSVAPRRRRWLRHPYCGCAWDQSVFGA
ncbi:hypothetical protein E8D34_17960 [Nocardioides sp. GY 10113]|uniref:hypothetical protein n=1 Tax=Nocardioides sp. GY 10113 TaxID=2569761 RepID=UPI0010A78EB9|nr:hypothetical protein [Nocardioides sp. GY 10113]TIC81281.1 hypothetical protein E8D34_17960 [Nocardioides sp. GY 10113]